MVEKELRDMTPQEIIEGVKSKKIMSCHYKTNADYLQAMNKK